ncbi:MAG: Threonine--tRNA ligase 2 [Chloroflexi bacterium]|nr:Threonine--tRNA ligase 2 [Chloroflexota bacterium]
MTENKIIQLVSPRKTVEVHLPNGLVLSGPRGATLEDFLRPNQSSNQPPIVGAIVNNKLRELSQPVTRDADVRPVTMGDADGMRFYRRSLTFLLESAFHDIYPNAYLTIDHSITSGGYFCQVYRRAPLDQNELEKVEKRMRELVDQDLPFKKTKVPLQEAIAHFEENNYKDKVRLLAHRNKDYLVLYELGEHRDYHHGYMVPSTGYLQWFNLAPMEEGFFLRFPKKAAPKALQPIPKDNTLLNIFRRYGDWLQRLGIDSVGYLNDVIAAGEIQKVIFVSEALHEQLIAEIAAQIAQREKDLHVVLIAGPSSSGKTTFSKRLTIQLLARGISPFPLEMDNYFVNRAETPKDESGELNFEALEAVNRERLGADIERLIAGERAQLPHYDFHTGMSEPGETVQLRPGQIIILEGIHGLNPKLIPNIPAHQTFRIYASALTQLNLDRHNRVSTTDTRLIRRIVRDSLKRGYTAQETISRWESVRRGEKQYIFPHQVQANAMFNSALAYELSALKTLAEPILRQVSHKTEEWIEANRLLSFLEWFSPLDREMIPDNSILQEFIGNSNLEDFKLWEA